MNKIVYIPGDVPLNQQATFRRNMEQLTQGTERALVFACDQKMEHLNDDFVGPSIPAEVNEPEHAFAIAQQAPIGAFATQPGMIARYGMLYPNISYIAKLNSKTNLISPTIDDPYSAQLWSVEHVVELAKRMQISLVGVGYTIYLGSKHEAAMLQEAATIVTQAHAHGLVAMLWIYPRGQAIINPSCPRLLMGAAGVANALGADIVKVHIPPRDVTPTMDQTLSLAAQAAGNTKVLASGGPRIDARAFLQLVYDQINYGNCSGVAVGRNVFQHTHPQAIELLQALAAIIYEDSSVEQAVELLRSFL